MPAKAVLTQDLATPRTVFLAQLDTEHFSWTAIGRTEQEATAALIRAWDAHAKEYGPPVPFWSTGPDPACQYYDIQVVQLVVGQGYRDGFALG